MYMPSPAHRRLLMILLVAGLGGFLGLMAWAAHVAHPQADLIRFFAVVWLLVFGAARILVHLDEALDQPGEAAHWTRLRGRGDL